MTPKYDPDSQKEVEKAMHEYRQGDLKIGKSNKKVKSKEQAIAIGLDKARRKGMHVPSEED